MSDIYCERLSVAALARAGSALARAGGLFYLDSTSVGRLAARGLSMLRLAPRAEPLDFRLWELEGADRRAAGFPQVHAALVELVLCIARDELDDHPAVERMSARFDHARLVLFLEKGLANSLFEPLAFAYGARRHAVGRAGDVPGAANDSPVLLFRRRPFDDRLAMAVARLGLTPPGAGVPS